MKRNDVFPSRYLGKDDVVKPLRAAIADVRLETIKTDHGDEDKAVMLFADDNIKPLIVNATNWETLEAAYGQDSDGWTEKSVEIYTDPGVMFGGRRVGGLRVRIPAGAPVNSAPPAGPPLLTWPQAVALADTVGISKEALVSALKERGLQGYNAARDTAMVQEIVTALQQPEEQGFGDESGDDGMPTGSDIPF